MATLPKTSAEILAAAKNPFPRKLQPRKVKTDFKPELKSQLSTFSVELPSKSAPTSVLLPTTGNVHSIRSMYFNDPVAPQTLEAALEIKERIKSVEEGEDLFEDEPALDTWVSSCTLCLIFRIYFSYPRHPRVNQPRVNLNPRLTAFQVRSRTCPFRNECWTC